MNKSVFLLSMTLIFSGVVFADHSIPKWDYQGKNSPENWGKISQEFAICATGKMQSPINISNSIQSANHQKINFFYKATPKAEINDGRTIEVQYGKGAYVDIDGHKYDLIQFHFHSPAEHLLQGKQYPLEMHLVHQDKDGHLVVVGIWFKEGKENKILDSVWKVMPQKAGQKVNVSNIDLQKLMPKNVDFFRYEGSLTTPPCTEGVNWFIFKQPLEVSKEQIKKFQQTIKESNNRPIQPLNDRKIIKE